MSANQPPPPPEHTPSEPPPPEPPPPAQQQYPPQPQPSPYPPPPSAYQPPPAQQPYPPQYTQQQYPPQQYPAQPQSTAGQPGDLGTRLLARIIDAVLLGVTVGVLFGILGVLAFVANVDGYFFRAFSTVFSTAVALGYYSFMESSRGQTVGKMLMKLRVQNLEGHNPTMEQALRRNAWVALSLIGIVPILGGLVGGLASLAAVIYIAVTINNDPAGRRGWHDQFGGTRVVRTA